MFVLDYQSRQPIYEQLYQNVVRLVSLGILAPNEQLPAVRTLAQQLGVNPNTVQKAYQMLERDGMICSVVGKGSFVSPTLTVAEQKKRIARKELQDAFQKALHNGMTKQEIITEIQQLCDGGKLE